MNAAHLIGRMALSPNPVDYWNRNRERLMRAPMRVKEDPGVIEMRPYGIARGIGDSSFPYDYTLSHYGGSLRGSRIGQWKDSLMINETPRHINAPNMFSWRSSQYLEQAGQFWTPSDDTSSSFGGGIFVL